MGSGLHAIIAFVGTAIFASAARWREAFGILGVCSFLTGLFYGWVWLLERTAIRDFRKQYGDLAIYPPDYLPRGWHSVVTEFEPQVLVVIWTVGLLLFMRKFVSELDDR